MWNPKYKGTIWDIDGTLLDSNHQHAKAFFDAFTHLNRPILYDRIRDCIGMGGDKLIPEVSGFEAKSDFGKKLSSLKEEIFKQKYFLSLRPFEGTYDLIQRLSELRVKLGVASSASADDVESFLKLMKVENFFSTSTSSDDVSASKPEPDIVKRALKNLGLKPTEAVMIGDTPYDLEAAGRAGVDFIAFRCGGWWHDSDFRGAVAIYNAPADLLKAIGHSTAPVAITDT